MKLYEINEQILSCIDSETGELIDPEKLNELQLEKDEKLENLTLWYKDLIAEANALKEEKEAFAAREKAAKNKAESIKNYLSYVLNGEGFKTTKCEDLTGIKKAIKDGEEIKGVHLEETQNIQIK